MKDGDWHVACEDEASVAGGWRHDPSQAEVGRSMPAHSWSHTSCRLGSCAGLTSWGLFLCPLPLRSCGSPPPPTAPSSLSRSLPGIAPVWRGVMTHFRCLRVVWWGVTQCRETSTNRGWSYVVTRAERLRCGPRLLRWCSPRRHRGAGGGRTDPEGHRGLLHQRQDAADAQLQ